MWHSYRRNRLRSLFTFVIHHLEQEHVDYWIDFGTLLGVTRDKDIIFGDNDIDICIWDTPKNHASVRQALQNMSKVCYVSDLLDWGAYHVYDTLANKDSDGNSEAPFYKKAVHVDLYVVRRKGDFVEFPDEPISVDLIVPTRKQWVVCNEKNHWCFVPNQVDKLLETRYGDYSKRGRRWYLGYF
jgi:hypothetical protein